MTGWNIIAFVQDSTNIHFIIFSMWPILDGIEYGSYECRNIVIWYMPVIVLWSTKYGGNPKIILVARVTKNLREDVMQRSQNQGIIYFVFNLNHIDMFVISHYWLKCLWLYMNQTLHFISWQYHYMLHGFHTE